MRDVSHAIGRSAQALLKPFATGFAMLGLLLGLVALLAASDTGPPALSQVPFTPQVGATASAPIAAGGPGMLATPASRPTARKSDNSQRASALSRSAAGTGPTRVHLTANPTPEQSTSIRRGATTEDAVNMHMGPGTSYAIMAQLPVDTPAQVLAEQTGWYHILTPWQSDGWVAANFFKVAAQSPASDWPPAIGSAGVVGVVNMRAGPGAGYPSIDTLSDGTVLEVLVLQGDWYKVRSPRGNIGWVAAEYVPLDWIPYIYGGNSGSSGTQVVGTSSNDVVRIAQGYLGARYVWGGSDTSGFDCSGLTWYVYQQVGVSLPAGSQQQFSTSYGQRIDSVSGLVPGDLVFFERTTEETGITHVGIYAGNGKAIAARSERLGVRYISLQDPFWSTRFVAGIRPYR